MDEEDPRIQERTYELCGFTEIGRTGIEWICIKKQHGVYFRRQGDRTHRRGDPIFNDSPVANAHYLINRWPNRKKEA